MKVKNMNSYLIERRDNFVTVCPTNLITIIKTFQTSSSFFLVFFSDVKSIMVLLNGKTVLKIGNC